jgi:hypothetical protein
MRRCDGVVIPRSRTSKPEEGDKPNGRASWHCWLATEKPREQHVRYCPNPLCLMIRHPCPFPTTSVTSGLRLSLDSISISPAFCSFRSARRLASGLTSQDAIMRFETMKL